MTFLPALVGFPVGLLVGCRVGRADADADVDGSAEAQSLVAGDRLDGEALSAVTGAAGFSAQADSSPSSTMAAAKRVLTVSVLTL